MSAVQLDLQFEKPREHYYGNVGAGNEPEVCANKYGRHTCHKEPNHEGPHQCGHHRDSLHFIHQCDVRWEEAE